MSKKTFLRLDLLAFPTYDRSKRRQYIWNDLLLCETLRNWKRIVNCGESRLKSYANDRCKKKINDLTTNWRYTTKHIRLTNHRRVIFILHIRSLMFSKKRDPRDINVIATKFSWSTSNKENITVIHNTFNICIYRGIAYRCKVYDKHFRNKYR